MCWLNKQPDSDKLDKSALSIQLFYSVMILSALFLMLWDTGDGWESSAVQFVSVIKVGLFIILLIKSRDKVVRQGDVFILKWAIIFETILFILLDFHDAYFALPDDLPFFIYCIGCNLFMNILVVYIIRDRIRLIKIILADAKYIELNKKGKVGK
jgi:hypothetical protein